MDKFLNGFVWAEWGYNKFNGWQLAHGLNLYFDFTLYGGFHKWWYPRMVDLQWKIFLKMDDLGVPLF